MDNYLTTLYFEYFEIIQREKKLMSNTLWEESEAGKMANIRNDQSISEIRCVVKLMQHLITEYLKIKKNS
jgi:hypothetical protein